MTLTYVLIVAVCFLVPTVIGYRWTLKRARIEAAASKRVAIEAMIKAIRARLEADAYQAFYYGAVPPTKRQRDRAVNLMLYGQEFGPEEGPITLDEHNRQTESHSQAGRPRS